MELSLGEDNADHRMYKGSGIDQGDSEFTKPLMEVIDRLKMCTDDNRIMMNNQFRYWLSQQPQVPSV
jgi:hypothetical protein